MTHKHACDCDCRVIHAPEQEGHDERAFLANGIVSHGVL